MTIRFLGEKSYYSDDPSSDSDKRYLDLATKASQLMLRYQAVEKEIARYADNSGDSPSDRNQRLGELKQELIAIDREGRATEWVMAQILEEQKLGTSQYADPTDVRAPWMSSSEGVKGWNLPSPSASAREQQTQKPAPGTPPQMSDIKHTGTEKVGTSARTPQQTVAAKPDVLAQAPQAAATTAAQNPSVAAAGALLGQRLKARLAAQSVRQSRKEGEGAADEVERARRVTRPSKFAYITIGLMGLSFDVLNWLVSVLVVVDLILAVIFFLSIRAMINRPVKTQQLFAVFLVLFICFLFIPIVGPIFAFPLLAIVLIAGAWNPNAKYSSFDREKLQGALDDFSGSVNKLQNLGKNARVAKGAASKAKSLSTVTSKAPKTTLRLGASAGAEAVPLISWLPLNIMNAVWTFVDMRKGYAEARRLVAQYEQQQEEAADAERASIRAETIANMEYVLRSSDKRQLDTKQPVGDNGSRRSVPVAAAPAQQAAPPTPRPVVRDVGPASSAPRTTPAPVGARA